MAGPLEVIEGAALENTSALDRIVRRERAASRRTSALGLPRPRACGKLSPRIASETGCTLQIVDEISVRRNGHHRLLWEWRPCI